MPTTTALIKPVLATIDQRLITRELSCDLNPGRLTIRFWIPGIADEHRNFGRGNLGKAGFSKQALNVWIAGNFLAVLRKMVQRGQRWGRTA